MEAKVTDAIDSILSGDTAFLFLTGGMGEFDGLCAGIVRSAQRRHPHLDIRLALVLPYMTNRLNKDKLYYETSYDEIIIPEELAGVHYKAAIKKRNRWLVDRADYILAYIHRDFGGAFETVKYAQKQGKTIINLAPPHL